MTEETQTEQPSVSIGDIMILKQVVEVATARGAFRANELTQIGTVYDRISVWIDTVVPPTEVADEETSEQTESGEENA